MKTMKKNESLELIKEMTKQPPPRTERKTFRQALIDTLYQMAQNEQVMNETREKNPQLYDLTMKVYFEEEQRRKEQLK